MAAVETSWRIRLDPWEAEYEPSVQLDGDTLTADVDTTVEGKAWAAVTPPQGARPEPVLFVDGVRRIDYRTLIETDAELHFGLLGSYAVGAVETGTSARIRHQEVRRIAVAGAGLDLEAWDVALPDGRATLRFDPLSVADDGPDAALAGLQNAMRAHEARLAESLAPAVPLLFLDGPLTYFQAARVPAVGLVKRLVRSYLAAAESRLLRDLDIGQRTPLFLIRETRHERYSWYARLGRGRPIDASLTGVVRLETSTALGVEETARLADEATALLPACASAAARDPRAPQNVYPVAGLETVLRHSLGDPLLVRRAIEGHVHRNVER